MEYSNRSLSKNDFGSNKEFLCVLKYLIQKNKVETIELEAKNRIRINEWQVDKFVFVLKLEKFKSYRQDPHEFDLNKLLVAVIWIQDFSKNVDEQMFIIQETYKFESNKKVVMPFSFITFQKPKVLRTEPRLPAVSLCAANFYGDLPAEVFNWIDLHLQFGVQKLFIYDGNLNLNWREIINENYGNDFRIEVHQDQSLFKDPCDDKIIYEQFSGLNKLHKNSIVKYLKNICYEFFNSSHRSIPQKSKDIGWSPNIHQIVVLNDCFTVLSKKYEFVAIYDFDEYIYPRNKNTAINLKDKIEPLNCQKKEKICSSKSLVYQKDQSLYNYLLSVIKNYRGHRSMKRLASIEFKQAETMPFDFEKSFIQGLGKIIKSVNSNTIFPLQISANKHHILLIEKTDLDFIEFIYNRYNMFIKCFMDSYWNEIDLIDKNYVRGLYFFPSAGSFPKTVHYYKNVLVLIYIGWTRENQQAIFYILRKQMVIFLNIIVMKLKLMIFQIQFSNKGISIKP